MKTLVQKISEAAGLLSIDIPAEASAEFEAHGMDSLDVVELSMQVEDTFGIEIPDEEVSLWRKVGDIEDSLKKRGKTDES